jgi:hypothetical protein
MHFLLQLYDLAFCYSRRACTLLDITVVLFFRTKSRNRWGYDALKAGVFDL